MRLIDADKLLDWVKAEMNPYGAPKIDYNSGLKVLDMIKRMPTIKPKIGKWIKESDEHGHYSYFVKMEAEETFTENWIPVSERKPETYTDVLVWFEYFRYGSYNRLYQTYGIGTYSPYDTWMINHETGWRELRVLAWMPMPDSYKEVKDNV